MVIIALLKKQIKWWPKTFAKYCIFFFSKEYKFIILNLQLVKLMF